MAHTTTTTPSVAASATVIPFPGTTGTTTGRRNRARGHFDRITRLTATRRRPKPDSGYQPRRVDVEPLERAPGDWRRMLMTMQRLT